MSESYTFESVEFFRTGTVGEPGERVFYIQIENNGVTFSFRCEKMQVAALAEQLARLLNSLSITDYLPTAPGDFVEPVSTEWTVANVILAHDEQNDRIVVRLSELGEQEQEEGAATATTSITREQALAFTVEASQLMDQGRPPCPWCERPLGDDHICPRTNGHGIH